MYIECKCSHRCRVRCLASKDASTVSIALEGDSVGLVIVGLPMGRCKLKMS